MAVLLFSGCESGDGSREYIEFDVPYLTTMTMTTTIPVDTYSEYMETYTPTETEPFDRSRYYYRGGVQPAGGFQMGGVYADTMATIPTVGPVSGVTADTPMTTTAPPVTEPDADEQSAETVTTETGGDEDVSETVTATGNMWGVPMDTMVSNPYVPGAGAGVQAGTAVSAVTAFSNNVTAYTGTVPTVAPDTMYRHTTTTTAATTADSDGGTDNAH